MIQLTWPRLILSLAGILCFHLELHASAQQVPVIRQVGVIPVQWQGEISPVSDLARVRNLINSGFPEIVREARRFQVINDEIVRELWDTADGRRRLAEDFELDAMLALSVQIGEDLHIWNVRILSPALDNYLLESERIPVSWFYQASDQEISARLRQLTFRLLNRYPIDVFVSSVQGRFVTLSAGKEQNLFEGQTLAIHRFRIASVHPAHNAWLSYASSKLGEVKIIDAKSHSSVAQLTSLSYEGAIRVGDGARVEHIASRQLFARLSKEEQRQLAASSALVAPRRLIEEPAKQGSELASTERLPTMPGPSQKAPASSGKGNDFVPNKVEEVQTVEAIPELPPEPPATSDQQEETDSLSVWLAQHLKELRLRIGIESFSYSQSLISARSRLPLWLLNRGELSSKLQWSEDNYSELTGQLGFGLTKKGDYFSFGGGMNWIQQVPAPGSLFSSMDGFEAGLQANFRSLAVSGENFGGFDILELGGLARLYGRQHLVESAQTIEYRVGMGLAFLGWGQTGLAGLKKSVSGMFTFELMGEAILKGLAGEWEYGGFAHYRSGDYENEIGRLGMRSTYLGILSRKSF